MYKSNADVSEKDLCGGTALKEESLFSHVSEFVLQVCVPSFCSKAVISHKVLRRPLQIERCLGMLLSHSWETQERCLFSSTPVHSPRDSLRTFKDLEALGIFLSRDPQSPGIPRLGFVMEDATGSWWLEARKGGYYPAL